jgi:uncharacterized membrane protein YozB (DUF420 family)
VVATLLLATGFALIRRGRIDAHRRVMLSATAVSAVFLVFYELHKAWRGFENTPYNGAGLDRVFYLAVLFSHLVLAMTVPVLAIALIRLGFSGRVESHRRLARWAWPIWMYVSVTGVVVYVMLYHLNPVVS